jgi:hypothetical protein
VCFFRLPFFAQAKKGDSLARRACESFALREPETKIKMDSRFRGNDVKREALDSGFRRNDEHSEKAAIVVT